MGSSYRKRRVKLKNHDAGHDRHEKTVAWEMKQLRLSRLHGGRQRKGKSQRG